MFGSNSKNDLKIIGFFRYSVYIEYYRTGILEKIKMLCPGDQWHRKIIRSELGSVRGLNADCSLCVQCRGRPRLAHFKLLCAVSMDMIYSVILSQDNGGR
jgi:hypothetical protein